MIDSAKVAIRVVSIAIAAAASWWLLANLFLGFTNFDNLIYFGYFLQTAVLQPATGLIVAAALWSLSGVLARRCCGCRKVGSQADAGAAE